MIERSAMPLSSTPPSRIGGELGSVLVGGRARVALLDDLLVDHELLGPVDGAERR